MKSSFGLLALAAAAKLVNAHTTVFAVFINDEDQGLGNSAEGYIRSPPSNSPVTDVTSKDMTCNVGGDKAAAKTLPVKAGDKVTFEWHHDKRDASDDIIASSHLGPVMVYMAPTKKGSAGDGWVKIAEEGYTDGVWAVDTLIKNKGKHSVTVPDVPAGDYLFRPEIIGLHEGNREGGAQFYMECVQLKVTSDGASTLPAGVSIPGAYKANDEGVLFDIYSDIKDYPIPGPAVWDGADAGGDKAPKPTAAPTSSSSEAAPAPTTSDAAPAPTDAAPTDAPAPPAPTTFATSTKPTAAPPSTTAPAEGGAVAIYQRCGGVGYTGSASCASGLKCQKWNEYYHQCVQA
ncbi:hypothetical protein P168DRAFT_315618 [Aspergillus campestris IBT 28561]|uniref:AA9 family lytic polysaccharide monooxygenase n=1 Tax=Aspergillus campestris (strain IBT 28561) TaxID=1392248 RepID=A0A2I1DB54_ASPC2|nr:uncharacterized protein P168DRAFT_315618 [Aspergillus campestris IBT 28561]PKY07095.1 hypothetical protein P168DRAFT_315618 [Aspergillus campestris IBT 28561]